MHFRPGKRTNAAGRYYPMATYDGEADDGNMDCTQLLALYSSGEVVPIGWHVIGRTAMYFCVFFQLVPRILACFLHPRGCGRKNLDNFVWSTWPLTLCTAKVVNFCNSFD